LSKAIAKSQGNEPELKNTVSLSNHFLPPTDSDCGRGFIRMEGFCVNVSYAMDNVVTFPSKCAAAGTVALNNYSTGILFLMKVE
jgi:hypothetical protein